MISLEFDLISGQRRMLPASSQFRLVGSSLRSGAHNTEIGMHRGGIWQISGEFTTALTLGSPVTLQFECASKPCSGVYGPFDHIRIIGGFVWAGPSCSQCLARLEEQKHKWVILPSGEEYEVIVFKPP